MMRVIYWRLRLQGFLGFDYPSEMGNALQDLAEWHEAGLIVSKLDIHDGFENLPRTFMRLFDGSHFGTLLVKNDELEGDSTP